MISGVSEQPRQIFASVRAQHRVAASESSRARTIVVTLLVLLMMATIVVVALSLI